MGKASLVFPSFHYSTALSIQVIWQIEFESFGQLRRKFTIHRTDVLGVF